MRKKNKQRLARAAEFARKEAAGDYSHLQNKKGEFKAKPLPQPTLPSIALDDDFDNASMRTRVEPGYNNKWQKETSLPDITPDYPPMPPYQAYSQPGFDHQQDAVSIQEHTPYHYDDRYGESQVALTHAAVPISGHLAANAGAGAGLPNPYSAQGEHFPSIASQQYIADVYDYNNTGVVYDAQPSHYHQHNNTRW